MHSLYFVSLTDTETKAHRRISVVTDTMRNALAFATARADVLEIITSINWDDSLVVVDFTAVKGLQA